ncbi:hypothetical protein [Streptomyces sp. NPDC056061]|uniref:hypothetical protein n=1 Tax=Streptomyces sp. NPDC056061 TaxID=3345700 RepID=UPI0035D639F2
MTHAIARLLEPVLCLPTPDRYRHRQHRWQPLDTPVHGCPVPQDHADGSTVHRVGERPPHDEDGPLVRPYFVAHEAHERQEAEARAAKARRRRGIRRGGFLVIAHGAGLRPRPGHGSEAAV